jgi:outer membrane protein
MSARYVRLGGFEDGSISLGFDSIPADQALMLAETVEDPAARMLLSSMIEALTSVGEISFATPRNQIGLRASLTYPLSDLFASILPAYRASQGQVEIEEHRLAVERTDVALAAEEAYYRHIQARASLEVARSAVSLAEEHLERIDALARAGVATEADRAAVAARVAAARSVVARAQAGVRISHAALTTMLHIAPNEELAIDEDLAAPLAPPPEVNDELLARAYRNRHEVAALEALAQVHRQSERASVGASLPHLVFVAGADYANPNQRVIPPEEEFIGSWEVGAALTWSPNDSVTAAYRSRAAEARRDAAEADLARLRDALRLQTIQAVEDQIASQSVMEAARERIVAAEASYQTRLLELNAGEAVMTAALDAQLEITQARLELINAAVDQRVAQARLQHALGELEW